MDERVWLFDERVWARVLHRGPEVAYVRYTWNGLAFEEWVENEDFMEEEIHDL